MVKKGSLEEKVKRARNTPFSLPEGVTMQKTILPDGRFAYIFRHNKLGDLGRMLILPHSSGQSQFLFEAAGEPDDPMTEKRKAILMPISENILSKMAAICGQGVGEPEPFETHKEQRQIPVKIMQCKKCDMPVAQMIIAIDANTQDGLEDYARIAYPKLKELNVPAWVVGEESEVMVNGELAGEALVMKVWPTREAPYISSSTTLNAQFDELENTHCKK